MLNLIFGWSRNQYTNTALSHFRKINSCKKGGKEFVDAVYRCIVSCDLAIEENKYNGDAHVLLANAFFYGATGFPSASRKHRGHFLRPAFAVLHVCRERKMNIKRQEVFQIAEVTYIKIADALADIEIDKQWWTDELIKLNYEMAIDTSNKVWLGTFKYMLDTECGYESRK